MARRRKVWLQQVGGAAAQAHDGHARVQGACLSHDDTRVIFSSAADSTRHVYEVPTLADSLEY
jgi:hypothetical protein